MNSLQKYLQIYRGFFDLTDSEARILAEMIRYHLRGLYHKSDSNPTSPAAKKVIAQNVGLSNPYSVNTYLQRLREKGAVIDTQIHPWLIPKGESVIEIHLDWKLNILE